MAKLVSVMAVLVVIGICSPLAMAEEDGGIGFDITADFYSKYVWRGQLVDDDYVFQPGISTTIGNFTACFWGNLEMTGYNTKDGDMTEVNYYADYSGTLMKGIDYSVGFIYYDFPTNSPPVPDTTEIYWGLAFDLPFSPSVTFYHDVDDVQGATYASFAIGHSIEEFVELAADMPVALDLGLSLGWGDDDYNSGYWGKSGSSLNDLAFSLALPFEVGGWSVTPSFNYVTIADSGLRGSENFGSASDHFFTGISIGTSF